MLPRCSRSAPEVVPEWYWSGANDGVVLAVMDSRWLVPEWEKLIVISQGALRIRQSQFLITFAGERTKFSISSECGLFNANLRLGLRNKVRKRLKVHCLFSF